MSTASEGLLLGATPTYIDIDGGNGLELIISRPRTTLFDYTLMFWVRSVKSYDDLKFDDNIKNIKTYLFKLEKGVGCYITRYEQADGSGDGPWLICENGEYVEDMKIDLSVLPDIMAWMHITYSANYKPLSAAGEVEAHAYLRIDISTFSKKWEGSFIPIVSNKVYYGAGGVRVAEKSDEDLGFPGHYRQFWLSVGYIEDTNVPYLMHEYKVLDYSTMGYYRFD